MSDHILLNYLRYMQTDCNLKITGDEFGTTGYSLGMSKDMTTEEKVLKKVIRIVFIQLNKM